MFDSPRLILVARRSEASPAIESTVDAELGRRDIDQELSVTAMLIPTNDGFFAVNGEIGPVGSERTVTYFSPAYDAGTEANDELCAHIPGPPTVCSGEGFNPSREGDVNFVHVHSAIHGVGNLSTATYDWCNPVAKIVINRVP
jgi:hypothetical protein